MVWAVPVSLAATQGIAFAFSSSRYLDVSVPWVCLLMCYEFTHGYCPITGSGFPHSEISGSMLTYSSPEHIGVSAVLLRLLVPRHPPCALSNLTNSASNPRRDPSSAAHTPSSRTQKYAPVFACLLPRLACVLKPSVFRKLAEKIQPCHFMNRLFRFCFNVVLSSFQRTSLKEHKKALPPEGEPSKLNAKRQHKIRRSCFRIIP